MGNVSKFNWGASAPLFFWWSMNPLDLIFSSAKSQLAFVQTDMLTAILGMVGILAIIIGIAAVLGVLSRGIEEERGYSEYRDRRDRSARYKERYEKERG